MFDLIEKKQLRRLLIWKYFFQIIIYPLILTIIIDSFLFSVFMTTGLDMTKQSEIINIKVEGWLLFLIGTFLIMFFENILSICPFIKLVIDSITKKTVTDNVIIIKALPPYELLCVRDSKRFVCDTFSRKKSIEMFIYDENKKKYRLFWNENYSSIKDVPDELFNSKTLKITYFKYSRIICDVDFSDQ